MVKVKSETTEACPHNVAGIQLTTCEGGLVQPTTTPWPSKGFHFCEIQHFYMKSSIMRISVYL